MSAVKILGIVKLFSLIQYAISNLSHDISMPNGECRSIDARYSQQNLQKMLENCVIVSGFVKLSEVKSGNFEHVTFPKLVEVRDYIKIENVNGIKSLEDLFPNLAVVGGENVINGRAEHIDNKTELIAEDLDKFGNKIEFKCEKSRNCTFCENYYMFNGGGFSCLTRPNGYDAYQISNKVLTRPSDCTKILLDTECTSFCPLELKHFINKTINQCVLCPSCKLKSCETIHITSINDIKSIDCQSIDNLIIKNLNEINESFNLERKLKDMFFDILEIKRHLIIENSSLLLNLNFLSNLQIIGSSFKNQTDRNFTLIIKSNENLQELFEFAVKIKVHGSILIDSNAILCHQKVQEFTQKVLKQSRQDGRFNALQKSTCLPIIDSKVFVSFNMAIIEVSESIRSGNYKLIYHQIGSPISHQIYCQYSCEIENLNAGTTYSYVITVNNSIGDISSGIKFFTTKETRSFNGFCIVKDNRTLKLTFSSPYDALKYQTTPITDDDCRSNSTSMIFKILISLSILTGLLIIFLTVNCRKKETRNLNLVVYYSNRTNYPFDENKMHKKICGK